MSIKQFLFVNKPSFVPIPSFNLLFGSLFINTDSNNLAKIWTRDGDSHIWMSRSTLSLALIARMRLGDNPKQKLCIFVPDYFCNSALTLLRRENINLHFYKVTQNQEPDKHSIDSLLKKYKPDLIIQVHYFGTVSNCEYLRNVSIKYGSWFIEDATHVILPVPGIGELGDFVLYSQYKHFPIPDGALLVFHNTSIAKRFNISLLVNNLDDYTQSIGIKHSKIHHLVVWILKRMIQNTPFKSRFQPIPEPDQTTSKFTSTGALASNLSLKILQRLKPRFQDYIKYKHSIKRKMVTAINLIGQANHNTSNECHPYLLRCLLDLTKTNLNLTLKDQRDLWNIFPFLFWPDLPPEVLRNPAEHQLTLYNTFRYIYLPIHQSISYRNIDQLLAYCAMYKFKQSSKSKQIDNTTTLFDK